MTATIISIGDELLIGQVVNTNAGYIGQMLTGLAIDVTNVITIGDDQRAIRDAISSAIGHTDVVITTGGLGPTNDDVTQKALAEYFGVELQFNEELYERLAGIMRGLGRQPTPAHKMQCYLPTNATLLHNGRGTAPGMLFERDDHVLFVLPGVPYEMRYLMEKEVMPVLEKRVTDREIMVTTIATAGEGESRLATSIEDIENNLPDFIKIAYLPRPGRVRIRLMGFVANEAEKQEYLQIRDNISERLGRFVYAMEDIPLSLAAGRLLLGRKAMVSVAESCTGGFLAHKLTAVPGSSRYFAGGAVTYSNELKVRILGVREETLEQFGAVSEETAREMVSGAINAFETDYAIAITGIAGPGGERPGKPVGTVWIAVGDRESTRAKVFHFTRDRQRNIEFSSMAALNMLRIFLMRQT